MRKIAFICSVVCFTLALSSFASAQIAATRMVNTASPTTKFINFADTSMDITYGSNGERGLILDPTSTLGQYVLTIDGYRKIHIGLGASKYTAIKLWQGKMSGNVLTEIITQPRDSKNIHSFDVIGPHLMIHVVGPPNTADKVQYYIYLTQ